MTLERAQKIARRLGLTIAAEPAVGNRLSTDGVSYVVRDPRRRKQIVYTGADPEDAARGAAWHEYMRSMHRMANGEVTDDARQWRLAAHALTILGETPNPTERERRSTRRRRPR